MKVRWFVGVLLLFLSAATLQGQSRESVLQAVGKTPDWTPSAGPTEYDEAAIEKLTGDRSSLIREFGFVGATSQDWSGREGRVRLVLYEMIDSAAAYGWFTAERDSRQSGVTPLALGTEAFRSSNRTSFWQSRYVVRLDGALSATESFGRIVSEHISGRSQKPRVATLLPTDRLVQGSEKYVLTPEGLGRDLGLEPSALGFDHSVEISTARYQVDGKSATLVLLLYPTQQIAKKFAEDLEARSPQEAPFRKRVGPLLAIVRGSGDPSVGETVLGAVNYESQVTWNEPPPDLSLPEVILTIFTFIGIALLFTLVAGISFGGLRVFVKKKYPDRVFDRAQDMEIIQLKLGQGLIRKELGK